MSDAIVLRNPTRENYNFVSWYTNKYLDDGYDIWVIPAGSYGNIDLYAKWDGKLYTVIYTDGVDDEEIFPTKYLDAKYNTRTPSFGANPTREGYVFVGWDKEVSPTVTGDVIYNAVWEKVYTITYHLNGGVNNDKNPHTFTKFDEYVIYAPSREGYYFQGWYDNKYFDGADIWVIILGTEQDVELYAKWIIRTFTIAYIDGVDGEEIFPHQIYEVDYNSATPIFKGIPTREGYDFVGWDKEISSQVTGDVVYTAVWREHVHTEVIDKAVAPTCTETGLTEGKHCSVCNEVLTAQNVVDALGHDYDAVVTPPTCVANGYTTYTCTVCGDVCVADKFAPNGHIAGEAVVENNITADCVNNGSYDNVVYCTVCNVEISRETKIVDALGHSYNLVLTLPTCEENGYTTYTCSCGDTYVSDEVTAFGHDWVDATTESPKTCNTCGATEGERLPSNDNPNLSIYEILLDLFIRIFNAIINFFVKIGG
jgi:uncharacterized repeat protein (TIGR02543 family)